MHNEPQRNNSRLVFAVFLIGIGTLWALKKLGVHFEFLRLFWQNIVYPLRHIFHEIGQIIFTWPMVMVFIGAILLAGKRSIGLVFIVVGGLFIVPKMFFWPELTLTFALPFLLIGIGVSIVVKRI